MPEQFERELRSDLPLPLSAEFRLGVRDKVLSEPNPEGKPHRVHLSAIAVGISMGSGAPHFHFAGTNVYGYTNVLQRQLQGSISSWLGDALDELKEADAESAEEGLRPCSKIAKDNAKQILESLSEFEPLQPSVYPTEDQEIAVFFRKRRGGGTVLLLSDSMGGGACFSSIDGKNRRARYDDSTDMPDAFVKEQLLKL